MQRDLQSIKQDLAVGDPGQGECPGVSAQNR